MCGLAGFLVPIGRETALSISESMTARLSHRGPDSSGNHLEALGQDFHLSLVHTLLRIIGKPGEGAQPFRVPEGILVFNGAIYNFQELKNHLSQQGRDFKTSTDTEVLAHGLALEGIPFLQRVRGMFAFAFWNNRRQILQLGRDPFGVKPLYLARLERGICFASEYKAILPHLDNATMDTPAINDYLKWRYTPGSHTLVSEIVKVAPGTVLEFDFRTNRLESLPYFRLNKPDQAPSPSEVFDLIKQAVARRGVADVGVAALLSGGIDSSIICDLLQSSVGNLETYTLSFSDESMNEAEHARAISHSIGVRNQIIPNTDYSWEQLERLAYHLDDPLGDPIIIALDKIFSFIKGQYRVIVTGEGADEIFSGYVHHRIMAVLEKAPRSMGVLGGSLMNRVPHEVLRQLFPYAARLHSNDYSEALRRVTSYTTKRTLASFLEIFSVFDESTLLHGAQTSLTNWGNYENTLEGLRAWDRQNWLCDSQLFKIDKIAMASSIEAREPFVDQDLIGAVSRLPSSAHFNFRQDKPILRAAVKGRLRIPPLRLSKRKSSFFQPLSDPGLSRLLTTCRAFIDEQRDFLAHFIAPVPLEHARSQDLVTVLDQKRLFVLVMLGLWEKKVFRLRGTGTPFGR